MKAPRRVIDWRSIDAQRLRCGFPSADIVWRDNLLHGLPGGMRSALLAEWSRRVPRDPMACAGDKLPDGRDGANVWLRRTVERLRSAQRAGVEPGDSDGEICRKALREARLMREWLDAVGARVRKLLGVKGRAPEWVERVALRAQVFAGRADLAQRGLVDFWPMGPGMRAAGKLKRLVCDRWWRRALRKAHALMVEAECIKLGIVRKSAGVYVSDDSLKRRTGQRARNAASLRSQACVNEQGQSFELAEVVARGTANPAVRRSELMTRIAGTEVIANEVGHPAQFVTVTCPSRMHKWKRGEGREVMNMRYDGTLPNEAQRYLAGQWAKFRAAAARAGLGLYGFRIAEPHHDGCPHWHLLLWHPHVSERGERVRKVLGDLLKRYFRDNDSPDEPGADRHRIKIEAVDPAKGSAVSYVAKYVAKNIDGYSVGRDLHGLPALESSARVEAWASTWRVRQFQQIGGPPVGVWRELRRVHPFLPTIDAVDAAFEGLGAVNLSALSQLQGDALQSEMDEEHRIRQGYAAYVRLQGGPTAKRNAHVIRLWREQSGEINRYGEIKAPTARGVIALGQEVARVGIVEMKRPRVDLLESERRTWAVVPVRGVSTVLAVHAAVAADEQARAAQAATAVADWWDEHGANFERNGEAVTPWTRVNNCTDVARGGLVDAVVIHRKTGQRFNWNRKPNGGVRTSTESDHEHPPPDHHPAHHHPHHAHQHRGQ